MTAPDYDSKQPPDTTRDNLLREQQDKFHIAFENAPMGMSIIGPKGEYLAVNPALCRMFGYTQEELLAGTLHQITHPDDVEPGNRWIRKLIDGDTSEPELEKRYIHRDGHVVWGVVRAQWLRNDDGSPRMSIAHVQDITERKRAEQALSERERQLREAQGLAHMGDWQLDPATGAMSWSEGVFRLLEIDPATTPSPSVELLMSRVHPDDCAMVTAAHADSVKGRRSCDLVSRLLLPSGRTRFVRLICRSESDAGGPPKRITGIIQDVTVIRQAEEKRAQLEAQLHRAQKLEAIGYLAGGVAHDFNNLLTVIGGNASVALHSVAAGSELAELLTGVMKGVTSATELTRQLLAFSRKQEITPKVMNLNDMIGQVSSMLRRLLGEDLELETRLAPDLGQVRLDPGQAEQILVNLAVNARDAMTGGGKLTIETANVSGQHLVGSLVMLAVCDTGSGMSDETKQRIFEPFFTTKEQGRGTGLGLAMVYGAVTQNRGHVEVQSAIGHGTTFRIYLPRVDEPADERPAKPPAVKNGGHEAIVFVEDDDAVRTLGERILALHGYRVHAFASGAAALAAVRSSNDPVSLLVTDVMMPGMNGRALSDEIKKLRPAIKVLFTSGYTDDVIADQGVLQAGIEFLAKPYSSDSLANRVRDVLG